MTVPDSIKVLHLVVTIELLPDHLMGEDDGRVDMERMTIEINESLPTTVLAETLWHELLHVIWYLMAIGEGDGEEATVHRISVGQMAVLNDNPELRAFLNMA